MSNPPETTPEPATASSRPSATVERLGAYELLLELASGGMATVHLARAIDKRQGPSLVAIKRPHRHLQGDKTFLTMLVDEARLASAIDHPHVVRVRELGFDGAMPFIVMDYIEGTSLAELRRELSALGRALDVRVAVRIVLDALAGLQAAHELCDGTGKPLHIVHRDVSPHNVLVGCDGRSHLTDFGIAKAEDRIQTTRTHEVKGKLAYLAPERIDRRRLCTAQSDVFSMAVVLWECFAGRRLFRGEATVDILQEVVGAAIPTLTQIGAVIPQALDAAIARALSRDLNTRYATAADFARALEHAAGAGHVGIAADVARLMEAMFAGRMTARQDEVRAIIGGAELTALLRESGLPSRVHVPAPAASGLLPAELAPPAPTGPYALGAELRVPVDQGPRRRPPWWTLGSALAGIAAGALVTLAVVSRRAQPAPIVIHGIAPPASVADPPAAPSTRRVVLPLPFAAMRVTLDDAAIDLDPAADVAVVEVPATAPLHHRMTAIAADGRRADGLAYEKDGIAQPADGGYTLVTPLQPPALPPPRPPSERASPPVGTVHNGFTKLR